MTTLDQLRTWVAGQSRHDVEEDLCVPDYSCCRPDLQVPLELREAYFADYLVQDSDPEAHARVERLDTRFLGRLLAYRRQ